MVQSSRFDFLGHLGTVSGSFVKSPRTALAPLCPSTDLSDLPDVQPHEGAFRRLRTWRLRVLGPFPSRSALAARGTSCAGLGGIERFCCQCDFLWTRRSTAGLLQHSCSAAFDDGSVWQGRVRCTSCAPSARSLSARHTSRMLQACISGDRSHRLPCH